MIKQASIRVNYFLNLSRIVFNVLVSLFTLPYINRVLGVENIGRIEYVNSIITYFILFSALGIPTYGIREIAKHRDNEELKSKFVIELFLILLITTLISYLFLFCFVLQIDSLMDLKPLMVIMSSMIFLSNIGVEWFYQGIEDQKFITIRFFVVKITTLGLLFLFVKNADDYLIYAAILVLSTVGGNFFNFFNLKNHISFIKIRYKNLNFKRHFKPILTVFVASISVSIYIQLDNLLLGSIAGSKSVGYYALANKLLRYAIILITTIGSVMLPRLSYLISTDRNQYNIYIKKVFNYFLIIALPFSVIFFLLAKDFILIMGGNEFLPSVLAMQILSPIIIIVSIAYFIGFLILYPQGKEIIYTIAVTISAIFSIVCNIFIIPKYGHTGVAFIAVLSELIGVVIMILFYYKELVLFKLINSNLLYLIGSSLVMMISITLIRLLKLEPISNILLSTSVGLFFFCSTLLLFKEETVSSLVIEIKNKQY
jgi:O-antigen/teichoic acid export membrane protein